MIASRNVIPNQNNRYGPWSIGVYKGLTPFELTNPKDISNPIITGKDIVDRDARFVADPFMVIKNGRYFMFFEVMNRETKQGEIGLAESGDGVNWRYKQIVIYEKFHLSYPYVFEWGNDYYLIPESSHDSSVRLYKAVSFPDKWEYIGNLLNGHDYADSSIFRHNDTWWLFVSTLANNVLNLYYSNNLFTGWKSHPLNPVVKFNKHIARPAGKVIIYKSKPLRLTQDDDPDYGIQVFAFAIHELSERSYAERLVSEEPVVKMTGKGWNAAGMHHVDLHELKDGWIAAVDGKEAR